MLFTQDQIFKLVTDEIIKFNRNMNFDHYIIPENNNPYSLIVRYIFKNGELGNLLSNLNIKYGYNFIEIKVLINNLLHPYYPIKHRI